MDDANLIARLLLKREKKIEQIRAHQRCVASLDAAISRYRRNSDFPSIEQKMPRRPAPPPKPRPQSLIAFKPGQLLQLSLAALKELGRPAYTSEIAQIIARNLHTDEANLPAIKIRLYTPLRKAAASGFLEQISGDDYTTQWQLGPTSMDNARTITFKTGEGMRLTLEALREIGRPARASEIASIIAHKKGFGDKKSFLIRVALDAIFRKGLKLGLIKIGRHDADGISWVVGETSVVPKRTIRLKSGEGLNLVLRALAKIEGPADIKQISAIIAEDKNIENEELSAVEQSLYGILWRGVKANVLERTSNGELGSRWQLASAPNAALA